MNTIIAAAAFVVGLSLAFLGALTPAEAQKRNVQLEGRVQWIAGQKLFLLPDVGGGIDIDISQVRLDEYRTLTQGDRVIVGGVVSSDNRKVYRAWVRRDARWDTPWR